MLGMNEVKIVMIQWKKGPFRTPETAVMLARPDLLARKSGALAHSIEGRGSSGDLGRRGNRSDHRSSPSYERRR